MDEKLALQRPYRPSSASFGVRPRRAPWILLIVALGTFWYMTAWPSLREHAQAHFFAGSSGAGTQVKQFSAQEQSMLAQIPLARPAATPLTAAEIIENPQAPGPVDLEAHIMSQCPDAADCLQQLIIPAMERVAPLVNFTLSFIGEVNNDGDVTCKHGPVECLGNQLMLCADSLYPDRPIISLGFANCLIADFPRLADRDFVEGCALQHAVDFESVNACLSDDARGPALLRRSVEWSRDAGVVYSCTVRVNGQRWCVRDDGSWKDCPDGSTPDALANRIRELAEEHQP